MEHRPGISDPDGWIPRWISRHGADRFPEYLNGLVRRELTDPAFEHLALRTATLRFGDAGGLVVVDVTYVLEQFDRGRIFHVLSLWSPGDPNSPLQEG